MSTTPVISSVTAYASRSISWDTTTLPSGTVFQGGVLFPDATLEERRDDDSVITENPVENGSVVNDHRFDLPQEVELVYVWSAGSRQAKGQPGFLETTYQKLLDLKQASIPLNVVTGRRSYQNLFIKGLSDISDSEHENAMAVRITLRQMIFALTESATISPAAQQALPQKTMPTTNNGMLSLQPGNNYNAGGN